MLIHSRQRAELECKRLQKDSDWEGDENETETKNAATETDEGM